MNTELWAELKPEYLYLHCRGSFEIKDALKIIDNAFAIAEIEGLDAVLVDVMNLGGPTPTTLERYDLGVYAADQQASRCKCIRIAVVGEEPMIDPYRFGETVARNHGAVAGVFTDYAAAMAWLGIKAAPSQANGDIGIAAALRPVPLRG